MNTKTRSLALSTLLLFGASLLAVAADEPKKPGADPGTSMPKPDAAKSDQGTQAANDASANMKGLDTNGDGLINKEEAGKMKGLSDAFGAADKDKDGTLDAKEFATAVSNIKK
jgi:EF hand